MLIVSSKLNPESGEVDKIDISELPVQEVLTRLGEKPLIHGIDKVDMDKAKMGEDLIFLGRTERDGKKTKRISTYFVCTDCHNVQREFGTLSSEATDDRLKYAQENGLPFLPGSTLWGIYNRTSFYNDDYVKKYGELVDNARDSLANAVQLCSKYCSSGRYLEDWELESIMHYFKKGELRMKELSLSENTLKNIRSYEKLDDREKSELRDKIKKRYRQHYSATFMETMPRDKRPYGKEGDVKNGELIYKKACMFCHENKRVTYLHLDQGALSGKMFWSNIKKYNDLSLYQIIRHGTYSKAGRKQYMPLFTKEKMSDEQLNDLVAYIRKIAKK